MGSGFGSGSSATPATWLKLTPSASAVTSWMEAYGAYGKVYWMIDAPDLGTLDEFLERLPTEEGYREILKAGSDLFVSGQTSDLLLKEV